MLGKLGHVGVRQECQLTLGIFGQSVGDNQSRETAASNDVVI